MLLLCFSVFIIYFILTGWRIRRTSLLAMNQVVAILNFSTGYRSNTASCYYLNAHFGQIELSSYTILQMKSKEERNENKSFFFSVHEFSEA